MLPDGRRINFALEAEGISGRQFQGKSDASQVDNQKVDSHEVPVHVVDVLPPNLQHLNALTLRSAPPTILKL